jgi:hypothetical protein
MADKDDTKELRNYVNNQRYKEAKGQRVVAGLLGGALPGIPLSAGMGFAAKPGRKAAVAARTGGRQLGEAALGSIPGLATTIVGAKTHNAGLMRAGSLVTSAGTATGGFHGAYRATKNAQLRGDIKKGQGMTTSAFGVDHGYEEIAKFSLKPIASGFKAMKFGQAGKVPGAVKNAYKGSIGGGQGKINSAVNAMGAGIKRSPGTAMAAGGLGTAAVGGTGYAFGRRKD